MSANSVSTSEPMSALARSNNAQEPSTAASKNTTTKGSLSNIERLQPLYDEWNRNPGQMPSVPVRKRLKAEVEKIGGAPYNMKALTSFFRNRIAKLRNTNTRDSRFPSLSQKAMEDLDQLLKTSMNPTPEGIAVWAQIIAKAHHGTTLQDVAAYISYAQAEQQRFPTPASISSPGSGPSSPALQFQQPVQSPGILFTKPESLPVFKQATVLAPQPFMDRKYTPSPPPEHVFNAGEKNEAITQSPEVQLPVIAPSSVLPPSPVFSTNVVKNAKQRPSLSEIIAAGVQEALQHQTPPATPLSVAEFDAMFSHIHELSHSLDRHTATI
ncbi:hypothetical protein CVT24_004269 [Panaeolus cyanescens]|uniref:Uncharacterized protein n=1 Tax=Panaeolus cyanescens TaxID=181874 RepID=A0A409VE37_9AGAR|nr:hypothetical protein CVT24_004269 [Panaeolus cyanescens]